MANQRFAAIFTAYGAFWDKSAAQWNTWARDELRMAIDDHMYGPPSDVTVATQYEKRVAYAFRRTLLMPDVQRGFGGGSPVDCAGPTSRVVIECKYQGKAFPYSGLSAILNRWCGTPAQAGPYADNAWTKCVVTLGGFQSGGSDDAAAKNGICLFQMDNNCVLVARNEHAVALLATIPGRASMAREEEVSRLGSLLAVAPQIGNAGPAGEGGVGPAGAGGAGPAAVGGAGGVASGGACGGAGAAAAPSSSEKKPKATCEKCKKAYAMKEDGILRKHNCEPKESK